MERSASSSQRSVGAHQGHHHHQHRKTNINRQDPGVDVICKVKYTNTLPDLPFEPKFLQSPFIALNRFVNYKPSTLEKNFKYELLTEPDLNVKIDLINPATYQIDSVEKPQIHPIDEQLIEDESVSQLNTKRSIQHRKVVPWMRKTEYISTEFNRYGIGQTGLDRPDTKIGYGMKKRIKDEQFEYKDRASQIAAIERTFADAKRKIKKHYIKPGVTAVEEFPIFPDFELWKFPFAQVIFDADPLPYTKIDRDEKLTYSILRGMADSEGNQFVGYFPPSEEALEQRKMDDQEEIGSYREKFEYKYNLEREYNWAVQNKASKGYEQENYFLTRRGNTFYYNELETRVKLARRAKSSTFKKNTILSVQNRPLNNKEELQMTHRTRKLFAIQEEEEVEEEEEGGEEEEEQEMEENHEEENANLDEDKEDEEKSEQGMSNEAKSTEDGKKKAQEYEEEEERIANADSNIEQDERREQNEQEEDTSDDESFQEDSGEVQSEKVQQEAQQQHVMNEEEETKSTEESTSESSSSSEEESSEEEEEET